MSPLPRELAYTFGEGGRLFGILARPAVADASKPVVVIPNTGVEHRTGPNRLHVQIARALAAAGYHVFRLDLSGLGDSDAPRGQQASVTQDLRLALDSLDTRVAGTGYALVGLCSGAHDGFQLALADARVTALFCIDGYTYPTPRFARLRWRGRLAHPLRSLGRVLKRLRGPAADAPPGLEVELTAWPSQQQAAEGYRQLLVRGTALGFVFTGDVQASYLYEAQHIEAFPFLAGAAAVWYLPHTDHTLTRRKAREELIALLRGWLSGAPQGQ